MQGWIKLHRKVLENPIVCKDSDHLAVWIYLLLNATHESYPALFRGQKITLEPGQLITGRKSISNKLSVSESKTKRILIELESDQQIDRQRSNQSSLITILNWDKYQDCEEMEEQNTYKIHTQKNKKNDQPATSQNNLDSTDSEICIIEHGQPVTSHRPASDQPVTTNKNVKNVKNERSIYSEIPPELHEPLKSFLEHRKKIKKPMSNHAVELMLKKLVDLSGGDIKTSIQILEQSILNGWAGVFPLKEVKSAEDPYMKIMREEMQNEQNGINGVNENHQPELP